MASLNIPRLSNGAAGHKFTTVFIRFCNDQNCGFYSSDAGGAVRYPFRKQGIPCQDIFHMVLSVMSENQHLPRTSSGWG